MKKLIATILTTLVIATFVLAPVTSRAAGINPLVEWKQKNFQKVVDDIASQVVTELPDDIHFRLLAIGPIEGDQGLLTDTLTAKIIIKAANFFMGSSSRDK